MRHYNIAGNIIDLTTVNVFVNGVGATVSPAGSFVAANVSIAEGANEINVLARDRAGNETTLALRLQGRDHTPPPPPQLMPVTSPTRLNFQTLEGRAESGATVIISDGANSLLVTAAEGTGIFAQNLALNNGVNSFTVRATDSVGNVSGGVAVTVVREADMPLPPAGQAAQINVANGNVQKGLANTELPRPLNAIVTDRNGSPVASVPVQFTVQQGSGYFSNNSAAMSVTTDTMGHASVRYLSGSEPGPQLIRANFAGNSGTLAVFLAETLLPAGNGLTSVGGVVLDQNLRALPNVLVRLGGQQTRSAADGRFTLGNVAAGPHQVLELIGREQITFPGRWPNLTYDLDILPGVTNELGRPLFLPRVNEGISLPLDNNSVVTQDTSFVLPVVGGEPPIKVTAKAGTHITFPPDVTDRRLSVTRIAANRVPMTLEDGLATNLYISVQPSGAIFEQPLEISFPNLDRLTAGSAVLLMSFDHDAGRYVRVGTGRVSADGRTITSDSGSGIRVGAWHALPPPEPQPEVTVLSHVKIKDNPLFEDATIIRSDTWMQGTRAVLLTAPAAVATAAQLDFRLTLAVPRGTVTQGKEDNKTDVIKAKVKIKDLTFFGETDKYFPVYEDNGTVYGTPHWKDAKCDTPQGCDGKASDDGDSRFPVAFKQDSFVKVSANFVLDKTVPNTPVKVKGVAAGLIFEATTSTVTEGGKSFIRISDIQAAAKLPNTIKFYDPLVIEWQVSFDDGKKYIAAGKTDNRAFVLLNDPGSTAYGVSPLTETLLDVSCRSANGMGDPDLALSAIWSTIRSRTVKRKKMDGHNVSDGKQMVYWGPLAVRDDAGSQCQEVRAMLLPKSGPLNGIGTCRAWAEFFTLLIASQGIHTMGATGAANIDMLEVKLPPLGGVMDPSKNGYGFLVNTWGFGKHIRTGTDGILNSDVSPEDYSTFAMPFVGNGKPNQVCVVSESGGALVTPKSGDDIIVANTITTGPNGICDTQAHTGDKNIIPKGKGLPNSVGISPGYGSTCTNLLRCKIILDSAKSGNDMIFDGGVLKDNGDDEFPFLSILGLSTTGINNPDGDVGPNDTPIKAQGISEPPPTFGNHFIIRFKGKFYDPSYGAGPFDTTAEHERAASSGIFTPQSHVQRRRDSTTQLIYICNRGYPLTCLAP